MLRDEPFLSLPTSLNSPRSFLQNGAENGPREEIEKAIFDNRRDISQEENDGFEPGREKSWGSRIPIYQWKSCGLLIRTKERRERLRESVRERARERGRGIWPQSLQ